MFVYQIIRIYFINCKYSITVYRVKILKLIGFSLLNIYFFVRFIWKLKKKKITQLVFRIWKMFVKDWRFLFHSVLGRFICFIRGYKYFIKDRVELCTYIYVAFHWNCVYFSTHILCVISSERYLLLLHLNFVLKYGFFIFVRTVN